MITGAVPVAQQLQQIFNAPCTQTSNAYSSHIFKRLHHCHTAALGMHHYRCDDPDCHHIHQQYHSCGNRHCPNCGGLKKEQWIENLTAQLFPTAYYHVVFTVPHEFHALMLGNRKAMFNLMFESASATLLQFGADPHIWAPPLALPPYCIPGDRIFAFIRTCTASSAVAVYKTAGG